MSKLFTPGKGFVEVSCQPVIRKRWIYYYRRHNRLFFKTPDGKEKMQLLWKGTNLNAFETGLVRGDEYYLTVS